MPDNNWHDEGHYAYKSEAVNRARQLKRKGHDARVVVRGADRTGRIAYTTQVKYKW